MGPLQERCLASWERHLSDYEKRRWDESNLPQEVMGHPYVRAMFQKRKWAFVSDYIRFWVLEREGGVYLDTDTEVLKSFDDLLNHGAFLGKTKDGFTAAGVIGALPHHQVIQDVLKVYNEDREFDTYRTSPRTVTKVLEEGAYADVAIYDYQYFNPCDDGEERTTGKLALAYTDNHWAESWVPFSGLRKILRRMGVLKVLKRGLFIWDT